MLGLITKQKEWIPVNDDPRVITARERTRAAMAEVERQEAIEQQLRTVLNPQSESATTALREITPEMIAEASTRLIPRRFGVTLPSHADTAEGNAARQVLKAAKAEEAQIRDEVRKELEQHVRDRVADVIEEFADAFEPCRKLAEQLLDLQDTSGINFPQVHSCLRFSNVENELAAVQAFAKE